MDVPSNELLRRALLFVGAVLLLFSVVLTEPQTAADMAVVTVGAVMVIVGLYLSRRAETTAVEKAEREKAGVGGGAGSSRPRTPNYQGGTLSMERRDAKGFVEDFNEDLRGDDGTQTYIRAQILRLFE